jgi:multiple sugar transport system substrate-binding protein
VKRETGLRVLELMRRMRDNFHPGSLDWNPVQLYDAMSSRKEIAYAPLAFGYSNYSRKGFRKNTLHFQNIPGISGSVLGGAGIGLSAKSHYLPEAARFAAWICSADIQSSVYVREQGQPANQAAWTADYANALTQQFFFNTFDSLSSAYVRPRYAGWPEFQKELGKAIHAHLKNDTDPLALLDQLEGAYKWSYLKT